LIEFFDQLQGNSFIKFFSDTEYRSLVSIPELKLEKAKQNAWYVTAWIAEELFFYSHPFLFPDFLERKPTKDEFNVQFEVIQTFSSISVEKIFYIEEFIKNYPAKLNNQRITFIKHYFIEIMELFQEQKLIESNYKILSNGKFYNQTKLTTQNISEGFVVYEKISI